MKWIVLVLFPGVLFADVVPLTFELGEEREIELDPCRPVAAYSSSDRIVTVKLVGPRAFVRALEFGTSTLTVFCEEGQHVLRISVPSQSASLPKPEPGRASEGSRGSVGMRLGYRSTRGLFDERVMQEEFFRYSERMQTFTQTGAVAVSDPIFYSEPKPLRTMDQVYWDYLSHGGTLNFRVGDLSPVQRGITGPVRGGRVDWERGAYSTAAWAGILRSGVGHPLTGARATPIGGGSQSWKPMRQTKLFLTGAGFAEHSELALSNNGFEAGLRAAYQGGSSHLETGILTDRHGRYAWDGLASVEWTRLNITANVAHIPDDMAVFSLPTRFGHGTDLFGLGAAIHPEDGAWHFGAGVSRGISFSSVDGFPGLARLSDAVLDARAELSESWKISASGSAYESDFSSYFGARSQREKGRRLAGGVAWQAARLNYLTLSGSGHSIEASRDDFNYENQQLALGWKREFSPATKDAIHIEMGATHLRYPSDPNGGGLFFLNRLSAIWDSGFLKLDGTVQGETRLSRLASDHGLRIQAALHFLPTPRDEFRVAVSHNWEWFRDVYSNARGFFLLYTHHFGSQVGREPTPVRGMKGTVSGRAYIDKNRSGTWDNPDEPVRNAVVTLSNFETRTDSTGMYLFSDVESGDHRLNFQGPAVTHGRLVNESSRAIRVEGGLERSYDFVYSDRAEILGKIYHDLNRNGRVDPDEPMFGATVRLTHSGNPSTIAADAGQFRVSDFFPGVARFELDSISLPAGYSPGPEVTLEVRPTGIFHVALLVHAHRTVSGEVFVDRNGNRLPDSKEKRLDGVTVTFGPFHTTTGEGGKFIFRNLPPMTARARYKNCVSDEIRLTSEPGSAHAAVICPEPR